MKILETIWVDHNDMAEAIADWLNNKYSFNVKPGHVEMRPGTVCTVSMPPKQEQDAQPIPEPEKPAYPKRSEVVFYCDGHRASLQTLPFWCSNDEKVFSNDGDFICMEDELQDG